MGELLARTARIHTLTALDLLYPAPKGASDFEELAASLKRCPDTNPEFFSKL
jgi:hypothetical protein